MEAVLALSHCFHLRTRAFDHHPYARVLSYQGLLRLVSYLSYQGLLEPVEAGELPRPVRLVSYQGLLETVEAGGG